MKVAIADDHQLILSSLQDLILNTDELELAGSYLHGAALRAGLQLIVPDILILDYQLTDETGLQLTKYITYHFPTVKVIILTGFNTPGIVNEVLENGGMGLLLKSNTDTNSIIEAIKRVTDGQIYIDPSLRYTPNEKLDSYKEHKGENIILTVREIEILKEIATGLSNSEIAEKLFISIRTVENHRNRIMVKSGSKNSVGLIKFAVDRKLINL